MGRFPGKLILLLFIAILPGIYPLSAQELNFRNIYPEDGLSQEQVTASFQDSKGYIWIGTFAGVSRYNGYSIERKFHLPGQLTNSINAINEDEDGRLFIASEYDGLFCFDGSQLQKVSFGQNRGTGSVHFIGKQPGGNLFLGTGEGVFRLRGAIAEKLEITTEKDFGDVNYILFLDNKNYFLCANNGFFRISNNRASNIPYPGNEKPIAVNTAIQGFDGRIWVGTDQGLFYLEGNQLIRENLEGIPDYIKITSAVSNPYDQAVWFGSDFGLIRKLRQETRVINTTNGLIYDSVRCLFFDKEQNLWIGTDSGLSILRSSSFLKYTKESGLRGENILDVFEDSRGRIILATGNTGITILDGPKIINLREDQGLDASVVYGIGELENGDILIGTKIDVLVWDGQKSRVIIDDARVTTVFTDSKNRVWIPALQGIFLVENNNVSQPLQGIMPENTSIYGINEDQEGRIWFCSRERGCLIWDGNSLQTLGHDQGLSEESVWCVDFDSEGRAWIGTNGGGLFVYDGKAVNNFTSKDGLADNYIWQILVDGKDDIWLGTNSGVSRFDGAAFKLYTVDDGLASNEGHVNSCLRDSRGNLWFGSAKGLSKLVDENSLTIFKPSLSLERIISGDINVPPSEKGQYGYDENNLTFEFSALSYRSPDNIQYMYFLEGADKRWNSLEKLRPVVYSKLSSGNYIFRVKAGYRGTWSDTVSYSFTILKPFYLEWWFYLILIFSTTVIISLVMFLKAKKDEREKILLNRLVEERAKELVSATQELKTFNTAVSNNLLVPLRHITGFCDLIRKESSGRLDPLTLNYLEKINFSAERQRKLINDLLKLSRAGSKQLKITRVDLSEMLKVIWFKESRKNKDAAVRFDIEEGIKVWADQQLLELLIDVLLSNALQATSQRQNPEIKLSYFDGDGKRVVSFHDNGIGFKPDLSRELFQPFSLIHRKMEFQGSGLGLNIAQRIVNRHGGEIWAEGNPDQGATVFFSFPEKDQAAEPGIKGEEKSEKPWEDIF